MTRADRNAPRLLLLGDARQVHLVRWAAHFIERGWQVQTVSLEHGERFPGTFHHMEITGTLPDALRYPLAVGKVRSIARAFAPNVVNAHFVPNYGLIAWRLCRHPWVLSTWGSDIMTDPDKSPFHQWRTRRILRAADWVTSDAQVMTRRIERFGIDPDRILTFPYGVSTERFRPAESPMGGGPRILINRKLDTVYGVETLIDAFPAVLQNVSDATLTVGGDGPLRYSLMERARESTAARAVTFVGAVDHARMPALLREHQLFVSTARSDTTSVSLLEAMASGLFPIVTDIPANREWITDGENGFLFRVDSARDLAGTIVRAWETPALMSQARARNQAIIAARARWEDTMRPVEALFDRIARP